MMPSLPPVGFPALLEVARSDFHKSLMQTILHIHTDGEVANADKDNALSCRIARSIYDQLPNPTTRTRRKAKGQSSGKAFEMAIAAYLKATFLKLDHLRPGQWQVVRIADGDTLAVAQFAQYSHLLELRTLAEANPQLAAILGSDYTITPDVVISRNPVADSEIDAPRSVVGGGTAMYSPLRRAVQTLPLLHASISAKWTIRSDRSQNSRTEALNLIRNRKGPLPHIAVVTAEPLPSRLASIALGTGDIDCVYHFALTELMHAVHSDPKADDAKEMLRIMIEGKRLRDISDLPLDLCI